MAIPNPAPISGLRGWYLAVRPATLPAAVVPVLVGTALAVAGRHFHPLIFLATLACSLLIQIGANFANDYYDFRKGADTAERLGPTRVTQSGIFTPRQVLLATGYVFSLALLLGAYLVWVGGAPIVAIGIFSILCAIGYTGGPFPLGYHGLGDLFVFIFFGVVAVTGTFYLQTDVVSLHALLASVPVGLLCTNLLVVNNLRDIDTDRAAGKHTLAVRIGRAATRKQYMLFQLISFTIPLTLWQLGASWDYTFWLPLMNVPRAVKLSLYVFRNQDRALNKALKGTAELHMRFGLLFALSLLR
jgi:1,4-dihydroxy-2-naphthoate octaprenyltransferase